MGCHTRCSNTTPSHLWPRQRLIKPLQCLLCCKVGQSHGRAPTETRLHSLNVCNLLRRNLHIRCGPHMMSNAQLYALTKPPAIDAYSRSTGCNGMACRTHCWPLFLREMFVACDCSSTCHAWWSIVGAEQAGRTKTQKHPESPSTLWCLCSWQKACLAVRLSKQKLLDFLSQRFSIECSTVYSTANAM